MLNHPREKILMDKERKGGNACTWFLKGDTVGTLMCQPTPGGELRDKLRDKLNQERGDQKI